MKKSGAAMNENDEVKNLINDLKGYLEFQSRMGNGKIMTTKQTSGVSTDARKTVEAPVKNPPEKPSRTGKEKPASVPVVISPGIFDAENMQTLEETRAEIGDCKRCKLHSTRKTIVFGEGNAKADLVFVGEGPGKEEDKQGRPFVGKAGKLLDKIIEAMEMKREDVYICNVVKCRPPDNRNPEPDEVAQCEPFLTKQLKSVSPRVIVCLGLVAAKALLKLEKNPSLGSLRGVFHRYAGIKLVVTYHPAALLRNPAFKRPLWEDMKTVMTELKRP